MLEKIIEFLKNNIKPVEHTTYGKEYRASVYLKDGLYLPCVIFRNPEATLSLAIKRFEEERTGKSKTFLVPNNYKDKKIRYGYKEIIKNFVLSGNRLNDYDIESIELSPYAFPKEILKTIKGETTMSWTGFVVEMNDGKQFAFGTTFLFSFFKMPERYTANDIVKIINHSYINNKGELQNHSTPFFEWPEDYDNSKIYRERPFFNCYIEGL